MSPPKRRRYDGSEYVLDDASGQSLSTGKSTFTQTLLYDNPNYLDQPTTFPIFIVVLTLTQVGLYFGYLFVTQDFDFQDPDYDSIGGPEGMWMTAVEPYPTCKNVHKEFWRYISYSLVHASTIHLCTNSVMQLALGLPLESVHGTWRTVLLYTFSACAGALNVTAFTPNYTVVGASGAIYGLLGVAVANLALNWAEMPFRWPRLIILSLFIANDGFMYLYAYDPFTSYSAHFGGFLFGFLFGFPVLKNIVVTPTEKVVVWGSLLLGCCVIGTWMAWYFLHPIPLAMIAPKATCCTNILRYGLPEENAEFQCVTYEGDSAALYGLDSGQLYQVEGEAWVVVE
jgi:rhomboid-related protein 1/2/3